MRIGWQKVWRQVEWLTDKWSAWQQAGRWCMVRRTNHQESSHAGKQNYKTFLTKKTIESDIKDISTAEEKYFVTLHLQVPPKYEV
jgi:hypothetical protein